MASNNEPYINFEGYISHSFANGRNMMCRGVNHIDLPVGWQSRRMVVGPTMGEVFFHGAGKSLEDVDL